MASRSSHRSIVAVLGFVVAVAGASRALGASSGDESSPEPSADDTQATASDASESEEVATNVPEKKTVPAKDKTYGHQGQFNMRFAFGGGYRIILRYEDSPPCSRAKTDPEGKPLTLCGFGAPLTLDAAIGYAPLAGVEPFLWGRFGLAKESVSNTSPLVILGAGVRLYTMSDSAFKFFIEPAIGVELDKETDVKTNRVVFNQTSPFQYKKDFILRLTIGPQLDFSRNFGAYAAAGLTAGMLRALQSWMDVHVGLQARFP